MKLKFKTANHPDPIVFTTKGEVADLDKIQPAALDPKQIVREMEVSGEQVSETGNLFFKMNNALGVRVFWSHLTTPEFVELLEFPNGGKIKNPYKEKVTVYRGVNMVVFDIDAIMYAFLTHGKKSGKILIPDVHVADLKDPKLLATELTECVLKHVLETGEKLDFEV